MNRIIYLVLFLALCAGSYGQEIKSAKELRKEAAQQKKEEKQAKAEQQYLEVGKLLEKRDFTLQARFLRNREGAQISVNPVLNFIQVDSSSAFLQIGSPQIVGYNAAGGISADGNITKWTLEKNDKRMNYTLFMSVLLTSGVIDIFMNIDLNGYATATLTGLTSTQLTYEGSLVPTEESDVHKGWTP